MLYKIKLNLATEKQKVLDLKAELQKLKDAARVARETAKVTVNTSYERGVANTKTQLSEEVAVVCRDYNAESWGVAMDLAGVLVDSELRRAKNIFFPEDIREILDMVPPIEQLPTTQTPIVDAEVSKGAGVGEEAQLPVKAKYSEDTLTIKDVVSQAKDVKLKSQAEGSQSEKADPQKDLPLAKT